MNNQIDPTKMTRQQYREWQKQQAHTADEPLLTPDEELTTKRTNTVLNDYDVDEKSPAVNEENDFSSGRSGFHEEQQVAQTETKIAQLKRKLNIAIFGLIIAIVLVYLILFFVG